MQKSTLIISIILLISMMCRAQVSEYYFKQQSLSYTEITGGTALWSTTFDDNISTAITIPSFTFDGTAYTSLYVSANGFITFGLAPVATDYLPISTTNAYLGVVSAFGCNLTQAGSGTPAIRYQQVSNEFVIQWKDIMRSGSTGERISFQVRLNTSTNYVYVVYGGTITPGSGTNYPQVGLRGADNVYPTNINNRWMIAAGGNWINSVNGIGAANTMYFNSATATTVPTSGLTFSWKPLYNPSNFTATAVSQTEIDLTWAKNSVGHSVMLASNSGSTFGTPVSGTTYSAGNPISGGGTVIYVGSGTSFNNTGLTTNSGYYYKIWSYDAVPDYSTGTTDFSRTGTAIPYSQVFTSTLPTDWITDMVVNSTHGTSGSYGLTKQLSAGTCYAITPLLGSITATTYLNFHYRILNNTGYPYNTYTPGENDKIEIQVSTDDGANFSTIHTINQSNHIVSTEFANKVISLAAYSGDFIKIRFYCTWGSGNYNVDIDNVLIKDGTDMIYSGSTTEQSSIANVATNSLTNNIIRLQVITQGSTSPLSLTSLTFNTTGCTNAVTDLSASKVYYTTTPVFSTVSQYGSTKSNPSGSYSVTGSQTLAQGNNYFWLVYDINSGATIGDVVDATCTQLITSESGTPKTPTAINPSGTRKIGSVISGTKTIPGSYATIAAAVTEINNGLIGSGGVTINVAAGYTETATAPILLTASGTAANPIIFQKSGSGSNPLVTRSDAGTVSTTITGWDGDGVIIIEGADYVTFDGIDVTASNQGIEYGYYLRHPSYYDGSSNVTIKNANITMTKGTSAFVIGICVPNNTSSMSNMFTLTESGKNENITIIGNVISNTFMGIYLRGSGYYPDDNFVIGSAGHGNTIQNFAGNVASSTYGIYLDAMSDVSIGYNTIRNMDGGGTAFTFNASGICCMSSISGDLTIDHNDINLTSTSSVLNGIYNAASCNLVINNNTISISNTTTNSATYGFIYNTQSGVTTLYNTNINYNTFASSTINSIGATYLIYNNNTQQSPSFSTIRGNSTSGTINRTSTSGTFYLYYNGAASTGTENIFNNTFSDITCAGTSIFWGLNSSTSTSHTQNVYNNTFSNLVCGSGTMSVINLSKANNRNVYGNTISGISATGTINVISLGDGSNPGHINSNEIFDITSTNSSSNQGTINGILVTSGTAVYLYNNFISDLKTPYSTSGDAIRGISITSSLVNSTIGMYYNTIYMNASSNSGAFGNSGIYHAANATATTAALDLRNNIVVNNSTPSGGYTTIAFKRSSSALNNYLSTSDNNIFYAGTPSSTNLIFTQTNCQTIEAFKTLVGPNRDSLSYSELPPFVNITTPPYDLRLRDNSVSYCESGAKPITTPIAITDDFDVAVRGTKPDIGADEFKGISPFAPAIPEDSVVTNITVPEKVSWCFNAYQTITVAGGTTTVVIAKDGSAEFIAGESIRFLPGFHAESGSIVLAHITVDSTFCDVASGSPIVVQPALKSAEKKVLPENQIVIPGEKSIKVYPNPNNGQFTIELKNIESSATVCIYNMLGAKVYQSSVTNESNHKINLPGIRKGIYFLKVIDGKEQFTRKMVVN